MEADPNVTERQKAQEAYEAVMSGRCTPNEARVKHGLEPLEDESANKLLTPIERYNSLRG